MKNTVKVGLLVSWIIVIMVLTGYPGLTHAPLKDYPLDKVYHFILFLILGILEYRLLRTPYFFLVGISIVLIAELQQLFIPGREFELLDILAGMVGLCFSYILFAGYRKIKHAISKA